MRFLAVAFGLAFWALVWAGPAAGAPIALGDPLAAKGPFNRPLARKAALAALSGDPFAAQPAEGRPEPLPGDPFAEALGPMAGLSEAAAPLDFSFGGRFESKNRFAVNGGPPLALTLTAFLEGAAKKGPFSLYGSLKGAFEGAASRWPGSHKAGWAEIDELYLTFESAALDLWLGRKIQRWGTADGYNPLDLFNPLDLRDPIASGRFLNRVPQWLAGASLSLGPFNLEVVYLPRPGVVRTPEPGSPWEPQAYRGLRQARRAGLLSLDRGPTPDRWFRDGEAGVRLSAAWVGWDLSLMAFRGYFDEPLFRLEPRPFGLAAQGEWARHSAYGLAWAKGLGQGTFRGELALKPDYPAQGTLGWGRARLLQAVVGWDRDFDGDFYLNFQGFIERQTETSRSSRKSRQGLTYEAKVSWALGEWAAGTRGRAYLSGEGAVSEIFLEWDYDDHFRFTAGAMAFTGSRAGVLGQYGDNDCLYLTGRYSF